MKALKIQKLSALALTVLLFSATGALAKSEVTSSQKVQTVEQSVDAPKQAVSQVSINNATQDQLISLKGIGEAKAKAIIDYRTKHGKFRSVDGLMSVPGIGTVIVEQNRQHIKL